MPLPRAPQRPLRAVLFDATGTLIEPAVPVGALYARTALRFGVELPAWRLDDAFARVQRRAPDRVFPGADPERTARAERAWWRERVRQTFQAADSSVRFADFDAFFAALYEAFASGRAWRLLPGAAFALRTLRARELLTGVVSNFDHRLEKILQDLGIASLLDVVMYPARCAAAKPERAIFEAALGRLGVSAEETLYVGHDPERDLAGAARVGLQVLRVAELPSLSALPAAIERLATLVGSASGSGQAQ